MAYSTAEIASIKTEYPAGTRIKLHHMEEENEVGQWPHAGTHSGRR